MPNTLLESRIQEEITSLHPSREDRHAARAIAQKNIAIFTEGEKDPAAFNKTKPQFQNSVTDPNETIWRINYSTLEGTDRYALANEFEAVIPQGQTMRSDIENTLKGKKYKTAVELGGNGINTFKAFSYNFFSKTIGTVLYFIGRRTVPPDHTILEVNIFTVDGINTLKSHLPNGKTDCIIQRIGGPLAKPGGETYPVNLFEVATIVRRWYELLNTGGIMYMQVPREFEMYMSYYITYIQEQYGERIEITLGFGKNVGQVIRMVKKEESPARLPLLSMRTIAEIGLQIKNNIIYGKTAGSMIQSLLYNDTAPDEERTSSVKALETIGVQFFEKPAYTWGVQEDIISYKQALRHTVNLFDSIMITARQEQREPSTEEKDSIKKQIEKAITWDTTSAEENMQKLALQHILAHFDSYITLYLQTKKV